LNDSPDISEGSIQGDIHALEPQSFSTFELVRIHSKGMELHQCPISENIKQGPTIVSQSMLNLVPSLCFKDVKKNPLILMGEWILIL